MVELSESFESSEGGGAIGGGAGAAFRLNEGKGTGGGGGHPNCGAIRGGGGGGAPGIGSSSSESCLSSEKSRSHRKYSRFRQPFFNSSQCKSFSDILISCTFGVKSMVGLFMTSESRDIK